MKTRYCLYARRSSEAEERQALSVEAQVSEMLKIAERDELEVVEVRRESHSAKESGQRPVFADVVAGLREGRFNGILVWHPDRLSRNAGDLGALVDLMDQKKLAEIRTYGQAFADSPSDKFLLMILCSQAKLENDNKSVNVKRGLRVRCEMGLWPAPAPTGYLNDRHADKKGHIHIDPDRGPVIKKMFERVAHEKWSGRKVYHWLRFELNFRAARSNKHLTLSNIYNLLQTPLYYGRFEYPAGSGQWYQGRHEPLISKELFDAAQEQLRRDRIVRGEAKEFAFVRLMSCGRCGSGVTAEEKFKPRKGGGEIRYVYYGCTRSKDRKCSGGYIREEELAAQVVARIGEIDLDEAALQRKYAGEYRRMARFRRSFLGAATEYADDEFDPRRYAAHVIAEGSTEERREVLGLVRSRVELTDKAITVSPDQATPQ